MWMDFEVPLWLEPVCHKEEARGRDRRPEQDEGTAVDSHLEVPLRLPLSLG